MQDEMAQLNFELNEESYLDELVKEKSSKMVRKHHTQVSNTQGIEPNSAHQLLRSSVQSDAVEVEDLDIQEERPETNGNILVSSDGDNPSDDYIEACAKETSDSQRFNTSHSHHLLSGRLEHEIAENRDSNLSSIYQGEWPIDGMYWNSASDADKSSLNGLMPQDTSSIMSFNCSMTGSSLSQHRSCTHQFGTKVDMVYSLLSMLGSHDKEDMSKTLLEMSASKESCIVMRQSGCLPLLVQLLHGGEKDSAAADDGSYISHHALRETRQRASQALHNIVHAHPDDKRGRREARVLRLLEQIRDYCNHLRDVEAGLADDDQNVKNIDHHPGPAIAAIMKLSFDEEHRHAICQLGGLQAIAELIQVDDEVHGNTSDQYCVTLRRYAGMALTNLTFGDGTNKALLCSMKQFMQALVSQLHSPSEDLRQVMASVLRNLSWRADSSSKQILRETGAVTTLMKAAMEACKESTLKSILSALWNLSAHCTANKSDICGIDGALAFLVSTLTYKSPSKTLAIIENGGGILRNISSHIAIQEGYRIILRKHNCLQILLQHLKSPSLTVVSNACGTLWNLSARCLEDQRTLWEMGAVGMLRNLVHSRHKMISMGSSAALKNLLSAKPPGMNITFHGSSENSHQRFGNNAMPSLLVRKQRALEAEIDQNLSETYDNTDSPKTSPTHTINSENRFIMSSNISPYYTRLPNRMYHSITEQATASSISHSESHDSIGSTCSEPPHHHKAKGAYNIIPKSAKYISVDHRHLHRRCMGWQTEESIPVKDNHIHLASTSLPPYSGFSLSNNRVNNSSDICRVSLPENGISSKKSGDALGLNETEDKNDIHSKNTKDTEEVFDLQSSYLRTSCPVSQASQLSHLDRYSSLAQKLKTFHLEEQETQDQPINFSLKYSDENAVRQNNASLNESHSSRIPLPRINNYVTKESLHNKSTTGHSSLPFSVNRENWKEEPSVAYHQPSKCIPGVDSVGECGGSLQRNNLYSSYAETDLDTPDQPTDYSQKYKEHMDTTEDYISSPSLGDDKLFHSSGSSKLMPSVHDDTLKVYCTEGTPLNFSSASSLTDLREITLSSGHPLESSQGKPEAKSSSKKDEQLLLDADHKDNFVEDNKKIKQSLENEQKSTPNNNYEKILDKTTKKPMNSSEKEGKTVTFDEEVNYAEETPLMFSRCSSLGSLSSFDQHSIHDDCSSVISDFSRHTSEVASPSDLPDSPSQTMPPSPCRTKAPVFDFTNAVSSATSENVICPKPSVPVNVSTAAVVSTNTDIATPLTTATSGHHDSPTIVTISPSVKKMTSTGVFEDAKTPYVEEGTPAEFSRATSLSSLTIDDEPKFGKESVQIEEEKQEKEVILEASDEKNSCDSEDDDDRKSLEISHSPSQNSEKDFSPSTESSSPNSNCNNNEAKSEDASDDEENEDLLAACISSGMPNNTSSSSSRNNNSKLRSRVNKLGSHHLRSSSIPLKATNVRLVPSVSNSTKSLIPSAVAGKGSLPTQDTFGEDSVKVYRTEGTPASLSHATSLSELSTLSCTDDYIKSNSSSVNFQDNHSDSSSVCDDNDSILLQCIQSGMPCSKKQQAETPSPNKSSDQNFKSKLYFPAKKSGSHLVKNNFSGMDNEPKKNKNISVNKNIPIMKKINGFNYSSSWQEEAQDFDHKKSSNKTLNKSYLPAKNSVSVVTRLNDDDATCNSSPACDSPQIFQVEGTPVIFSRSDSLSSLSCEDENEMLAKDASTPYKLNGSSKIEGKQCVSAHKHHTVSRPQVSPSTLVTKSTQDAISHSPMKETAHSHTSDHDDNSSFHSLRLQKTGDFHSYSDRDNSLSLDVQKMNLIEGTPVCFSRNSSLSSLSIESLNEPSSSEQALLEECISCGMPKEKPSKQSKTKRNRIPKPTSHCINSNVDSNSKDKCKKEENNGEIKIQNQFEILLEGNIKKEVTRSEPDYEEKGKEDERSQEKTTDTDIEKEDSELQLDTQRRNSFHDNYFVLDAQENQNENKNTLLQVETDDKNERMAKQDFVNLGSENEASNKIKSLHLTKDRNTDKNSNLQDEACITLEVGKEEVTKNCTKAENPSPENDWEKSADAKIDIVETILLRKNNLKGSGEDRINQEYVKVTNGTDISENELVKTGKSNEYTSEDKQLTEITFFELANEMCVSHLPQEKKHLSEHGSPKICNTNSAKSISEANEEENFDKSSNVISDTVSTIEEESSKMTLSATIFMGAKQVLENIEADCDTADEMTASTVSCLSDLDNVKPPSVMGDILSISLTSSGLSDGGKALETRPPNQKLSSRVLSKNHKQASKAGKYQHVPEMVRRALGENLDSMRLGDLNGSDNSKTLSNTDLVDSVSMKSSCTSDLLENINPPSVMDDISLTTSCASLSSISSEILDDKSHADSGNMKSTCTDDMFERFNAASAMVQLYSRELSNIMTGSVKNTSTTEIIDHVKPPSVFQDLTEVTVGDITEIACDTLGSDTELEEELPCDDDRGSDGDDDDDEIDPGSDTLQASHVVSLCKDEPGEGSTENLTLTLTEEVVETDNKNDLEIDTQRKKEMTAEEIKALQLNADLVVCALNNVQQADYEEEYNLSMVSQNIIMIEDESISLVSSESDDDMPSPESQEGYPEPVIKRKQFWENLSKEAKHAVPVKREDKGGILLLKDKQSNANESKIIHSSSQVLDVANEKTSVKHISKLLPPSKLRTSQYTSKLPSKSNTTNDKASLPKADQRFLSNASVPSAPHRGRYVESSSSGSDGEEKPKPLIKQGTFVKEKPSRSTTHILPPRQNYHNYKASKSEESSADRENSGDPKSIESAAKTELIPHAEDENLNVKQINSGTFTRRKKFGNVGGHSFSSQEDDSENLSDRRQTPSPSYIGDQSGSLGSCSTSNVSLSSSSSTGTSLKKPDKVIKQVPSKVAAAWKKKDKKGGGRYLTREAVLKHDRAGAPKSPLLDSNSSSCSSRSGEPRIPSIITRTRSPGMQTPSPQGNLSRSSTYEKLSQENQIKMEGNSSKKPSSSSPSLGKKNADNKIDGHTWKKEDAKYDSSANCKQELLSNKEKKLPERNIHANKSTSSTAQHSDRIVQSKDARLSSCDGEQKMCPSGNSIPEPTSEKLGTQHSKDGISFTRDGQPASSRVSKQEVKSMIPTPFKKVGTGSAFRKGTVQSVQQDVSEETAERRRTCLVTTV